MAWTVLNVAVALIAQTTVGLVAWWALRGTWHRWMAAGGWALT
jgi:hypothetical protein